METIRRQRIENVNIDFKIYTLFFFNNSWFLTFKIADLQDAENTRILRFFFMILGEEVLLGTLITMVPTVFEKNDFKGYLSHSQISKYFMLFLDSETSPWTQFLWKGLIFDTQHDALKVLRKFENFGKSRNNIWVPPLRMMAEKMEWYYQIINHIHHQHNFDQFDD